ncbi:HTTM domain-containing protein [Aurantibacter crassamenti]|uniref:HTTM domain-containing protein n=1 Tax=Aurantibacter crassamenti TaxID=1837375 RepID=UPI00193A7FFD|nr:HTTM domain-containing protein [Aurantibacter crassamenti]MBM1105577.1 HTTM domain-containing protein [Aurantibacter crassamenti]
MFNKLLFTKVDNSQLILFRIFFGLLIALESYGAIITGWIKRTLIEPKFTFNFIGFDWLQPLPGNGMYFYFFIMGTLGIFIMLGYKYIFSMIGFTLLWAGVYFMQKTSYNNHYYLLLLISLIMCFFPANKNYSYDAKHTPTLKSDSMYSYVKWVIVFQLFIVYTYAAIAKMYGDWLDFSFIKTLMANKANYYVIGEILQQPSIHKIIGFTGIFFDLLIIPALLWKPTRNFAFGVSIFFHLFNSIVFQIGIFPYLSLAFIIFFYEPETIRKTFFKKKTPFLSTEIKLPSYKSLLLILGGIYFCIQLVLPIRHYFIKDNVLWTEEGHRLSWRMMLRSRTGQVNFKVTNKESNEKHFVNLNEYLSKKQLRRIGGNPDFIWQLAQRIKKEHAAKGEDIMVHVISKVSVNGKPYKTFIDPKVDLANAKWNYFWHNEWILPSEIK